MDFLKKKPTREDKIFTVKFPELTFKKNKHTQKKNPFVIMMDEFKSGLKPILKFFI